MVDYSLRKWHILLYFTTCPHAQNRLQRWQTLLQWSLVSLD
jgi:hypothetical protein